MSFTRFQNRNTFDSLKEIVRSEQVGPTAPRRIPLALIDEDPDQPRRHFDEAALAQLAESIRMVGVLQPVGVQPTGEGRYLLRWGARRVRAVALTGLADVPAVLVGAEQGGLDAQVIENQHRVGNSNSELAEVIERLRAQDKTHAQIAVALALPGEQSVKFYRVISGLRDMPELARWIDQAEVRALYELHLAWQQDDGAHRATILEALAGLDELTVAAARRIKAALKAPAETLMAPVVETVQAQEAQAHAVTPGPKTAPPRPARRRTATATDDADPAEAERVGKVQAWLDSPQRPRPPLTV